MNKPRTQTQEQIDRQIEQIGRALSILADPDQVIEVRIPKVDGKKNQTDAGYYRDREALAQAVIAYNGRAHGVYVTLNPVNPDLLSRAANRMKEWAELTTSDKDILSRRWLPLDLDPVRPSGISSNNAEHAAALARSQEIRDWLTGLGWPAPVEGDSGNGAHLLYRVDLPNDTAGGELVQKCIQAIAHKWNDQTVNIDTGVYNPARIWKLYGTRAAKGDNTEERPHRWAYLVNVPEAVECVPVELLQQLAATAPTSTAGAQTERRPAPDHTGPVLDVEDFISRNAATLKPSPKKQLPGGSVRWRIDCPWGDDSHKGDAFILQLANGALSAGCSHASCQGRDWHALRDLLEPRPATQGSGYRSQAAPSSNGAAPAAPSPTRPDQEAQEEGEPKTEIISDLPTLDSLIAELATVEPGDAAQRWAVEHIKAAAQLPEPDRLQLQMQLSARKVPKLFLDRQWAPVVARQAERDARAKGAANPRGRVDRYKVLGNRISESYERTDPETGETSTEWRPLCNFDARVMADIEEDDGEHVTRNIAIVGALCTGEALPEITVKAEDFEQMAWPVKSWGARISVEPGRGTKDKLRHAIQTLSNDVLETRRVYTHTGWRVIDGDRVFLTASGGLGLPGVSVNLPGNLNAYALPQDQAVNPAEAMRASLAVLDVAPDTIAAPLWAAMYLAPLSEIIPPAFTLWVEGESGSLKSSYSAVMLNHYGPNFTEFNLPAAWDGTANSLEKLCFHAKDIPLLIDDFRPLTNRWEAQKLQDAASKIIRAAGNRQGRSRLDSESEFRRVFSPRGVVLATAERGALGKSTNARLLTIDVNPGDITPAMLGDAQARRPFYGYAMAGYIRWVGRNYGHLVGELQKAVIDVRALQNGNGHKRLPGAMAALYTAFNLAMTYAQEIKAISASEAQERAERCYNALQQIAADQADLIASQDPALQFLQVIVTLLRARKVQIECDTPSRTLGENAPTVERIGWHDGQKVYLLQNAYNRVARYLNDQGEIPPSDETTLNKELQRRGYLASFNQNDNDKRIKIQRFDPGQPGQRTRVIVLRLQTLFDIAATMKINSGTLYAPARSDAPQE
jgi:hypothetical protein